MDNNYKPKITLESTDKYEKARNDLIKAKLSFMELPPQDQKKLAEEALGIEITTEMFSALQYYLGQLGRRSF